MLFSKICRRMWHRMFNFLISEVTFLDVVNKFSYPLIAPFAMSIKCNSRFDLSMSRRTRRPAAIFNFSIHENCQDESNKQEAPDDVQKPKLEASSATEQRHTLMDLMKQGNGAESITSLDLCNRADEGKEKSGKMTFYVKLLNHLTKPRNSC